MKPCSEASSPYAKPSSPSGTNLAEGTGSSVPISGVFIKLCPKVNQLLRAAQPCRQPFSSGGAGAGHLGSLALAWMGSRRHGQSHWWLCPSVCQPDRRGERAPRERGAHGIWACTGGLASPLVLRAPLRREHKPWKSSCPPRSWSQTPRPADQDLASLWPPLGPLLLFKATLLWRQALRNGARATDFSLRQRGQLGGPYSWSPTPTPPATQHARSKKHVNHEGRRV